MRSKTCLVESFLFTLFYCSVVGIAWGPTPKSSEIEEQEYRQDMQRIKALQGSLKPGQVNDFEEYETFGKEIQSKWKQRDKEHFARLMLEICGPLSSGNFKDDRGHDLAREYALSALGDPNRIPLDTELELIGHVMTRMFVPGAPMGQEWTDRRRKDVEVRLRAWRRLIDAIDPKWDPNDFPLGNVVPPATSGLPSGATPEAIQDPKLRAEYEAAIEKNRQKAEEYNEQYTLHGWLTRFPPRGERYIIQAYSKPPYKIEELTGLLNQYMRDEQTRTRILDAVRKNMEIAVGSGEQKKE